MALPPAFAKQLHQMKAHLEQDADVQLLVVTTHDRILESRKLVARWGVE
jgi:hypothetical protein